jgi:dTDP-D-glucose 4,6-dehydratase
VPDRPYNDQRYFIDITKAREQLGWEPTTRFEEGPPVVSYMALHFINFRLEAGDNSAPELH